jgi:hypothetical protein
MKMIAFWDTAPCSLVEVGQKSPNYGTRPPRGVVGPLGGGEC